MSHRTRGIYSIGEDTHLRNEKGGPRYKEQKCEVSGELALTEADQERYL
jgi:hypothetical protein